MFPSWWMDFFFFTYRSVQIFKILFWGLCAPGSDPPHTIMRYQCYSSRLLSCWFPPDQYCFVPVRYQVPKGKLAGLALLTIFTWFIRSIWSHILGYHYRGGGGIFPKVKRLSRKCVGTLKRLISGFGLSCVGSQKRRNFLPRHIATSNHVCIFSPAHRLSESARKLVVRAILGVWPQFWC